MRDPWAVLVSEVMLQQTQAARVEPVFTAFMARFPEPSALARAPRGDAIRAWEDLGYYRRAVALHAAAVRVSDDHGGALPRDPAVLRTLPGIGPYTAAAVASIGYGVPVAAVDTNVRRIVARVVHGREPDEVPARDLQAGAQAWLDRRRPGRWNEALMDLGRARCRPAPRCDGCPLRPWCRFAGTGRSVRPPTRAQARFEGSSRQARGAVLAAVRSGAAGATLPQIVRSTGMVRDRVAPALDGLVADGLVERSRSGTFVLPP